MPRRAFRVVYGSLELMQTEYRPGPQTCHWAAGSLWLWETMEARDEEQFTFWIVSLQRVTVVRDAAGGHVDVCGLCYWPR